MEAGRINQLKLNCALQTGPRLAQQLERAKTGIRFSALYDGHIGFEQLSTLISEIFASRRRPAHTTEIDPRLVSALAI